MSGAEASGRLVLSERHAPLGPQLPALSLAFRAAPRRGIAIVVARRDVRTSRQPHGCWSDVMWGFQGTDLIGIHYSQPTAHRQFCGFASLRSVWDLKAKRGQ